MKILVEGIERKISHLQGTSGGDPLGSCTFEENAKDTNVYSFGSSSILVEMLKRRYIEDYLVTDCNSTEVIAVYEIPSATFPNQKFEDRAHRYVEAFMRIFKNIKSSERYKGHQYYALRTKVMDFIEELFFHFGACCGCKQHANQVIMQSANKQNHEH